MIKSFVECVKYVLTEFWYPFCLRIFESQKFKPIKMKKLSAVLGIFLFFAVAVNAQESAKVETAGGAEMTFDAEVIDYGTIAQNADGVRTFTFTNTGNAPLIISNAKGSCGCTVPTWPKQPINPGEKGEIKVKYATNRTGPY